MDGARVWERDDGRGWLAPEKAPLSSPPDKGSEASIGAGEAVGSGRDVGWSRAEDDETEPLVETEPEPEAEACVVGAVQGVEGVWYMAAALAMDRAVSEALPLTLVPAELSRRSRAGCESVVSYQPVKAALRGCG